MPPENEAMDTERSWPEYRRSVLEGLERIERRIADMDLKIDREITAIESRFDREVSSQRQEISDLKVQVGMMKAWATLLGAIAGALMTAFVQFVFKR